MIKPNEIEKRKQIKSCRSCDFFHSTPRDMDCVHPKMELKTKWQFPITCDNKIPEKCPLRDGDLVIRYSLFNEVESKMIEGALDGRK